MTSCCLSANPNNLRFWHKESHGAAMFLGFLVWTHTNKRRIGSPSNTQTMKTKTKKKKSGSSQREKQLKKAITNRLAEKGISKDWMKNHLLVIC
jgi:hypothetical protein